MFCSSMSFFIFFFHTQNSSMSPGCAFASVHRCLLSSSSRFMSILNCLSLCISLHSETTESTRKNKQAERKPSMMTSLGLFYSFTRSACFFVLKVALCHLSFPNRVPWRYYPCTYSQSPATFALSCGRYSPKAFERTGSGYAELLP